MRLYVDSSLAPPSALSEAVGLQRTPSKRKISAMNRGPQVNAAEIVRVVRSHGATYIAIFGSVAREEATERSDVDVLVAFDSPKSLFDLSRIERELEESVGRDVDLLSANSMTPDVRDRLLADAQVLNDRQA